MKRSSALCKVHKYTRTFLSAVNMCDSMYDYDVACRKQRSADDAPDRLPEAEEGGEEAAEGRSAQEGGGPQVRPRNHNRNLRLMFHSCHSGNVVRRSAGSEGRQWPAKTSELRPRLRDMPLTTMTPRFREETEAATNSPVAPFK